MSEAVKVIGLAEFGRSLKRIDSDLPKALRIALNQSADVVIGYVRPRVPRQSGRAAASIKAKSTRTAVRVSAGGKQAPYYPWLDYGGRVGRKKSVKRAFLAEGRYLYPGYFQARDSGQFQAILTKALTELAESAGLEVS